MEKKSDLKFNLRKVFNIIILVILLVILFMYIVILYNTITKKEVTLNFFNWKPFIVVADSPEAGVNVGDMAVIKDIKIEDLKPGDIIVYRRGNSGAIKKVKDISKVNEELKIVIEDDSIIKNESVKSSIEGKYMFKIAGLGNIMLFLQTPLGAIILFSIFIYIVIMIRLIGSKSNKGEMKKELVENEQTNEENVNTNLEQNIEANKEENIKENMKEDIHN
ncbi:MAG: hypothetical protein HFJ20_06210 [Clostridia bacterium]|nr:hypothetical protein [Clostridia bacterium]